MANQPTDIHSIAQNLLVIGVGGGVMSFFGIFIPWFFSDVFISGTNLGAENEIVYIIALAVPAVAAVITLIISYNRQDIYVAALALALSVLTLILFTYVLTHSASGLIASEEFVYWQVMRLSEYRLGFLFIVVGPSLILVSALSNLILKIALSVVAVPSSASS